MSRPWNPGPGDCPLRPSPVAVLAVAESVTFGLVVRHASDRAAVTLILTFFVLFPAVVGYRTVAASDRRSLGALPPPVILLMLLAAGVAHGGWAVIGTLLLMPFSLLMVLLGGMLALTVREACNTALRMTQRLTRATASLRAGGIGVLDLRGSGLRAERNHASHDVDRREAWRQVIIRTPL